MTITVTVDTTGLDRRMRALPGQLRFAAALTLTALAKDGQDAAQQQILTAFDRPTAFTRRGVRIHPATKARLESQVFVADIQAGYLVLQETGGERRPRAGAPITVPVGIRLNASGNIPRGAIKRELAKPTAFAVSPRDAGRLPPGIYRRMKRGAPKLLVALERQAQYRPRFGFQTTVRARVRAMLDQRWREAVARALATARR